MPAWAISAMALLPCDYVCCGALGIVALFLGERKEQVFLSRTTVQPDRWSMDDGSVRRLHIAPLRSPFGGYALPPLSKSPSSFPNFSQKITLPLPPPFFQVFNKVCPPPPHTPPLPQT